MLEEIKYPTFNVLFSSKEIFFIMEFLGMLHVVSELWIQHSASFGPYYHISFIIYIYI